ncbi:MAG: hypothetical protein A2Y62_02600, partial [Candidatus Fischerbacteria bacterium RBG_13_37_8]
MNIKRGDIYWANLEPVVGAEIGKKRPAIIISNNKNNEFASTLTIIPITSREPHNAELYEVYLTKGTGGLSKDSKAKCNQIRTIDKSRILTYIGNLDNDIIRKLELAIKIQLDMTSESDRL